MAALATLLTVCVWDLNKSVQIYFLAKMVPHFRLNKKTHTNSLSNLILKGSEMAICVQLSKIYLFLKILYCKVYPFVSDRIK